MELLAALHLATFSFNGSTYCLPGYSRSSVGGCAPSSAGLRYSLETGGQTVPACKIGETSNVPRVGLRISGSSGACEVCAGGPAVNLTQCLDFGPELRISGCAEYYFVQNAVACWRCAADLALAGDRCVAAARIPGCRVHIILYNNNNNNTNQAAVEKCQECERGYAPQNDNTSCRKIENCDEDHLGVGWCGKCEENYFFDAAAKECLEGCPQGQAYACGRCKHLAPGCESYAYAACGSDTIPCEQCRLGYINTNNTNGSELQVAGCEKCADNCDQCEAAGGCIEGMCSAGFYYFSSNESAELCRQPSGEECPVIMPGCEWCEFYNVGGNVSEAVAAQQPGQNRARCTRCAAGYSMLEDQTGCVECSQPYCVKCSRSNQCEVCSEGFSTERARQLQNGVSGGNTADNGSSEADGRCYRQEIDQNCAVFSDNDVCLICAEDFVLDPLNKCVHSHGCLDLSFVDNWPVCRDCDFASYTANGAKLCGIAGCASYNQTTHACTECKSTENYFLSGGSCYKCHWSCKACENVTNATQVFSKCTTCNSGDYPDGAVCSSCNEFGVGCQNCNYSGCTSCEGGYFLDEEICELCSDRHGPNCAECNASSCTKCSNDTVLFDGVCRACRDKYGECEECDDDNCTASSQGTYTEDGLHVYCGDVQCISCNEKVCDQCADGYFVNKGHCIPCYTEFGAQCEKCNSSRCTQCQRGLVYDNNSTQCTSCREGIGRFCSACETFGCTQCAADFHGYNLNSKQCGVCQIEGCLRCIFHKKAEKCIACANPGEALIQEGNNTWTNSCGKPNNEQACAVLKYSFKEQDTVIFTCLKCANRWSVPNGEACELSLEQDP